MEVKHEPVGNLAAVCDPNNVSACVSTAIKSANYHLINIEKNEKISQN